MRKQNVHKNFVPNRLVLGTQCFPSWSETLAVTTPWSVEFNKDILLVVEDNFLEVVANKVEDGVALCGGNRLALQLRFEFAVDVLDNPVFNNLGSEFRRLIQGVLELLLEVLDDKGGPFGFRNVESLGVITKFDGVNPDKVDLGFIFGSDWLDLGDEFLLCVKARINKEVGKGLSATSVHSVVFTADFVNDGDRKFLDPVLDVFLGDRAHWVRVLGFGLVKAAVDNNGRGFNASSLNGLLVRAQTEQVVFAMSFGDKAEDRSGGFGTRSEVGNSNNLVRFFEFVVVVNRDFRNRRKRLSN